MSHEQSLQIAQLLLKPAEDSAVLDEAGRLSDAFILSLQVDLATQYSAFTLCYNRPMGAGLHVLGLQPPQPSTVVQAVSEFLSLRDDIAFVEADRPR